MNGRPMNLTLECEQTMGEVLQGIETWLEKNGSSMSAIALNGQALTAQEVEKACTLELINIDRLDIHASTWTELLYQALTLTSQLLYSLEETTDARVYAQLIADWEKGPIASHLVARDPDLYQRVMQAFASKRLGPARESLAEREREIDNPREELAATVCCLEPTACRLEAVPLELQTGKDAAAAESLRDFTFLAEKILRLIPLLRINGCDVDALTTDTLTLGKIEFISYIKELDCIVQELSSALEKGDAVLIGDLAEYELAPRLRVFAEIFLKIT